MFGKSKKEDGESALCIQTCWIVVSLVYVLLVIGYVLIFKSGEVGGLKLNELGDFFAGMFMPLFILWVIVGYAQQRKELELQREELKLQRKELHASVAYHGAEVGMMRDRTNRELAKEEPNIEVTVGLRKGNVIGKLTVVNHGGTAYKLSVKTDIDNDDVGYCRPKFKTDEMFQIMKVDEFPLYIEYKNLNGDNTSLRIKKVVENGREDVEVENGLRSLGIKLQ